MRSLLFLVVFLFSLRAHADGRKAFNELKKSFPRDYREKEREVNKQYKSNLNESERKLDKSIKEAEEKLRKEKEKLLMSEEYKSINEASPLTVNDIMLMGTKKGEKVTKIALEKIIKVYNFESTKYWFEKIYPNFKEKELSQAQSHSELRLKKDLLEKAEIKKKSQSLIGFINQYDFSAFNAIKNYAQKCHLFKNVTDSVLKLSEDYAMIEARVKVRLKFRPNTEKIKALNYLIKKLKYLNTNSLQGANMFLGAPPEKLTEEAYTYQQEMKKQISSLQSDVNNEKKALEIKLRDLETNNKNMSSTFFNITEKQIKEYYKDLKRDMYTSCKDKEAKVELNKFSLIKPEI